MITTVSPISPITSHYCITIIVTCDSFQYYYSIHFYNEAHDSVPAMRLHDRPGLAWARLFILTEKVMASDGKLMKYDKV